MAHEGRLRRSMSLKRVLPRRKLAHDGDDEPLPFRPAKMKYVQVHVTADIVRPPPPYSQGPTPPVPPERRASRRATTRPTTAPAAAPATVPARPASGFDRPPPRPPPSLPPSLPPPPPPPVPSAPAPSPTRWRSLRQLRRSPQHVAPLPPRGPVGVSEMTTRPLLRFAQLPREICGSIVDQLERLHVHGTAVDAVGRQRDLHALLRVDKRWHGAARERLYADLWLPTDDPLPRRRTSLRRPLSRLKLLRRTLRERAADALMVRRLRVSADLAVTLDAGDQADRRPALCDVIADVIAACPNLEYFSGYCPVVEDDRSATLHQALSGCAKLKAHAWNIRSTQLGGGSSGRSSRSRNLAHFTPSDMRNCHSQWRQLETLVLCSSEHLQLGPGMISAILQQLPSLKHLMLSHLSRHDFHNGTLLGLPPLRALRLEYLEGVTSRGVEQLAYARTAVSLERLSLVGLDVTSLRTIQTLLAHLTRLTRFTVVQDTSPEPQWGVEAATTRAIHLESPTLRYLHWDILVAGSSTAAIADAIARGRFPALRTVKVPCDADGAVQAVCRPVAQTPLTARDREFAARVDAEERYERCLRLARIQAQVRIRESRQRPSFHVIVQDEHGRISHAYTIGGFLGTTGSPVEYCLAPDVEGSHDALIDFADVEAPRWLYEHCNEMDRSVKGEQMLDLLSLF